MFHSFVTYAIEFASRRRAIVLLAAAGGLLVSIAGIGRLTFDPDVLSLLPRDGIAIPAFRDYLRRVGSLDALYVVFTAPDGYAVSDYRDEVDAWVDALRQAPEIARVDAGIADPDRDFQWLADRRLLLLRDDRLDRAIVRLQPDGIGQAVAESRQLLAVPSAEVADLVRHDPVRLFELVREAIGTTQAGPDLGAATTGYMSSDGRSRLVIAHPREPPFDASFSRALDERLQAIRVERAGADAGIVDPDDQPIPPIAVDFAGGHRVAVETEAIVKQESILNTVGSLALILPLLYVVYRRFWLVTVGPLPTGLALVIVLGALGFAGARLSSAATGAAAMLFGLGIDGVVLLYVTYLHRTALDASTTPAAALSGPSTSMLLGMWTTAATFYGLTFIDFPSLQQLGLLIGHSMVICGLLTLVLVPALLPKRPQRVSARGLTMPRLAAWTARRRRAIAATAALATIVLGACAFGIKVDPTLNRLRSVTPAATLEADIAERFGLPSDVYVGLAEGPALEPLLIANEQLGTRLSEALPQLAVQLPTGLLPSTARQEQTADRIANARLTADAVGASLERARVDEGFRSGSFDPFVERLPRLLDPQQRLTYDGFLTHGLGDLVQRLVVRDGDAWMLVSYFFPGSGAEADELQRIVRDLDPSYILTGLPLVNQELADRFVPQFAKGLVIGTVIVIALIAAAFRDWRLSLYALLPTVVGLIWTAGILAVAHIELDLFAIFAVVTFLGIGVDYGIHLVHRFKERGNAVQATAELAPVILVAGAITFLGYGTLINSSYPPLRSIGVVSAVSVVALVAASVLVLPALLHSGRRV